LSSDSGCDVQCESLDKEVVDMNSILFTWKENLMQVVQQEADRAEKITQRISSIQTERQDKTSFNEWRQKMLEILSVTTESVKLVNTEMKSIIESIENGDFMAGKETPKENFSKLDNCSNSFDFSSLVLQKCNDCNCMCESYESKDNNEENWIRENEKTAKDLQNNSEFPVNKIQLEAPTSLLTDVVVMDYYWEERYQINSEMLLQLFQEIEFKRFSELNGAHLEKQFPVFQEVRFVEPGEENDILTNWSVFDKFGQDWQIKEDVENEDITENLFRENTVDVIEKLWKISLDIKRSTENTSLQDILKNLPVWDSADIFLDSIECRGEEEEEKNMHEDPIDIFHSIHHILYEDYQNTERNQDAWNTSHKFGREWEDFEEKANDETDNPARKVCLMKVFWGIAMNKKLGLSVPSHTNITLNLPVRDWPDVNTDGWKMSSQDKTSKKKYPTKDPLNVFKSFKNIFEVSLKSASGKIGELFYEPEEWKHCAKKGNPWKEETPQYEIEWTKHVKDVHDEDVMKIFWDISEDEQVCISKRSHLEINENFPSWFGPDAFEDLWDSSKYGLNEGLQKRKNKVKDPINIFKKFRKIFYDIVNYPEKSKVSPKVTKFTSIEDIFSDSFVNVFNSRILKRKKVMDDFYSKKMNLDRGKFRKRDLLMGMKKQEEMLIMLLENLKI